MARDIYSLLDEQFGGKTETGYIPDVLALTNADQVILRQDPRCIAWTFINLGAAAVFLRPNAPASATAGIQVPAGGVLSLTVRDDFHLPALEWHCISPSGNQAAGIYPVRLSELNAA